MAEINATLQQISSANLQSTIGAEKLAQLQGRRQNSAVSPVSIQSPLTDILEEIGNAVGKFADKRTLRQSKLRQGAGVNRQALKRIADFYDRLPDAPTEDKLRDLVRLLESFQDAQDGETKRQAPLSADDILKTLQQQDTNARRQYMLLQGARAHFEHANGTDGLLSLLDSAEKVFNDSGIAQDVRADFAMLPHARKTAPGLGVRPEAVRDQYRELILSGIGLGSIFSGLSKFYKRLSFHAVIDLFLKAAGDDLAATSNETDKSFLGSLLKELGILKTLRSVFEGCGDLLDRTQRVFPDFGNGPNAGGPNELMTELLSFSSKNTPNMEDAKRIFKPFETGAVLPAASVVFSNGLLDLHRELPDTVFPSHQARLQQVGTLTGYCEILADIEESAFEANFLNNNKERAR